MTRWSSWQQTYRWLLVPRKDRPFPKRWSHWLPLTLIVALVASVATAAPWLFARVSCRPGLLPTSGVWSQGDECVGVSDGPYAFGLSTFDGVFQQIANQNKAAGNNPCGTQAAPVTVGVLLPLTSLTAGGRARNELEGFAAGQANANSTGCVRPIRLRVAQIGKDEQAAVGVAQLLADSPDIVAVVGMGPSDQRSAQAIQTLANHQIPVVSDVITAEGFDQNGSRDDHPDFSICADRGGYDHGIGQGFFYRVAYRVATQATALGRYLKKADFIITPTTAVDPFTCTSLPLLHREFGENVHEVRFDPADPTTVALSVQQLCRAEQDVTAVYAARAQDLSRFLIELDAQYQNGFCKPKSITVASISDASRIRVPEPDINLEALRGQALTSTTFTRNKVRLAYTPLANPEVLLASSNNSGFVKLENKFTAIGFDRTDLDDGWAINAYDALTTVAAAVNIVPISGGITRSGVNTAIGSFSSDNPVPAAAQGPLTFDNNGNRSDSEPVVVRVCPATGPPPHSTTAEVYPSTRGCP